MAEHGTSVRLNQIASEAGVTAGAVLYHYPNMQELLFEANQSGMARFHDQRLAAMAGISDPAQRLIQTIKTGVPEGPEDPDVRLLCALGGEAARNNLYALLLTSLFDRQVSMYQGILEMGVASGAFDLRQDTVTIARNLVALEDAYGYRMMAKHPTLGYETAVELILEYARLATGHPLPLEK
jgi:AcrR family transcriptional regulator